MPATKVEDSTPAAARAAERLAASVREAGALALAMFQTPLKNWTKGPTLSPVSEADIAVDNLLRERLAAVDSTYAWLSEESVDDPARLAAFQARYTEGDPLPDEVAWDDASHTRLVIEQRGGQGMLRGMAGRHHARTIIVWIITPEGIARGRATTDAHDATTRPLGGEMSIEDFIRLSRKLEPTEDGEEVVIVDGQNVTRASVEKLLQGLA